MNRRAFSRPPPSSALDAPVSTVDLSSERALVEDSAAALKGSDYAMARAKAAEAVGALLARPETQEVESWLMLLARMIHEK